MHPPLHVLLGDLGDLDRENLKQFVAFDERELGRVNEAHRDVVVNVMLERIGDVGERLWSSRQ